MAELLDSLREKDEAAFHRWTKSEAWATVEQLMEANGKSRSLPGVWSTGCIFLTRYPLNP